MRKTVLLLASMTIALMLASVVALVTTGSPARAAFPGINGKIVFARDPDGPRGPLDQEIYTIWFNGNNLTRLTNNSVKDLDPAWSADGKKIVFSSKRSGKGDIYTMNANGSNPTLITNERLIKGLASYDAEPGFSPSGGNIVFARDNRDYYSNIYKVGANGKNLTRLTNDYNYEENPAWSPNGNKIAYDQKDPNDYVHRVVTMRPDGSGKRYLSRGEEGLVPNWSPDGSEIVADGGGGIYKINADGSEMTRLTHSIGDYNPAFSPGGGKIVFSSDRDGDYDLYIMKADGTDSPQRLTNQPGDDYAPDWQPIQ
jgi:TolB protein